MDIVTFFACLWIDHRREPLAHFVRGLVRESDREDVLRRDALRDEIRHPRGDHARLAGARARENQQRTLGRAHRLLLLGIEIEKSEAGHVRQRRTGIRFFANRTPRLEDNRRVKHEKLRVSWKRAKP